MKTPSINKKTHLLSLFRPVLKTLSNALQHCLKKTKTLTLQRLKEITETTPAFTLPTPEQPK